MIFITTLATGTGWWISHQAADRTVAISSTDIPLLKKINRVFTDLKDARLEEKRFLIDRDSAAFEGADKILASEILVMKFLTIIISSYTFADK